MTQLNRTGLQLGGQREDVLDHVAFLGMPRPEPSNLHMTKENLRRATATLVNANYAARDTELGCGHGVRVGFEKFGSWESNLTTGWHARYRGPGVMIGNRSR